MDNQLRFYGNFIQGNFCLARNGMFHTCTSGFLNSMGRDSFTTTKCGHNTVDGLYLVHVGVQAKSVLYGELGGS